MITCTQHLGVTSSWLTFKETSSLYEGPRRAVLGKSIQFQVSKSNIVEEIPLIFNLFKTIAGNSIILLHIVIL